VKCFTIFFKTSMFFAIFPEISIYQIGLASRANCVGCKILSPSLCYGRAETCVVSSFWKLPLMSNMTHLFCHQRLNHAALEWLPSASPLFFSFAAPLVFDKKIPILPISFSSLLHEQCHLRPCHNRRRGLHAEKKNLHRVGFVAFCGLQI
jgi:hypothetical protein